jgi:glycosyltransferase involved in cell wall biosynthesis
MDLPDLTVVILTFNEQVHIQRAIANAKYIAREILIVDSFSTDRTVEIAQQLGATVIQNKFINQAQQMNWVMDSDLIKTEWTFRLDADEYLTPELISEIQYKLPSINHDISGLVLKRQVHFMGKWIRYGGYYPVKLLRIWRTGYAQIEKRSMDEHTFLLKGNAITLTHDFIDDNLNSLSWWTQKHNIYSTREAIDILNSKYHFNPVIKIEGKLINAEQAEVKRWYKDNLYLKLPLFIRCFLYFNFRYWIKLGFMDGRKGLVWHFLQGFWYRFLVDSKILQIEWMAKKENKTVKQIVEEKYNY